MRIKHKRNLTPVSWSIIIIISWIFRVKIIILILEFAVSVSVATCAIVASSHVIVGNFYHDVDFASFVHSDRFDAKLFS